MTRPIAILPGWCLGRGPLQSTATALGGDVIDLPGYGERPLVADFAAAADALAADLPVDSILLGWSLGAMLALAIAARHPHKVNRLVLVAGTASFVARPDWPHAMPPQQLAQFSAAAEADIAALLPRFVGNFSRGDARAKAVMRAVLDLADPFPAAATLATGLAWLRDVDLRPQLAAVHCPTLLVHGANDPLMPLAATEMLAAALPHCRLAVLPDCAHTPFLSDSQSFLAEVRAFLACTQPST